MQSNEKLRALVNLQTNQIKVLNAKLEEETKAKNRFYTRFKAAGKARDKFWNLYINQIAKTNEAENEILRYFATSIFLVALCIFVIIMYFFK